MTAREEFEASLLELLNKVFEQGNIAGKSGLAYEPALHGVSLATGMAAYDASVRRVVEDFAEKVKRASYTEWPRTAVKKEQEI